MQVYLVGGAVRDALLGRDVRERDWVVVGATPEQLQAQGYTPVGRDFPVFLHPETHEEYALARTERKTAPGYHGFAFHSTPDVTLKADLARRDLTINAMAQAVDGTLIDPYGGQADLEQRLLRHVSPAFAEDPVRILRLARFAARFAPLGFTVAPATQTLMRDMVQAGEVDALVPERVWQELAKALAEPTPAMFFRVLRDCGALGVLFPELEALFGVPQPAVHHPEIDTGVHTLMVVDQAARLSEDPVVRFAALVHDLGKGLTPPAKWPSHPGHEAAGVALVDGLCDRLKVPNNMRELGRLTSRYHLHCHRVESLRPRTILATLGALDAFRRPQRLEQFLLACEADYRGRAGLEQRPYPQAQLVRRAYAAAAAVAGGALAAQGLRGPEIGAALRRQRLAAIKQALQ